VSLAVLRALLAMRMDYVRATNIAASIGQGMAWLFGFIGLFTNPFLMFIALFVWIGAAQGAGQAQMKSALAGLPVSRVMMPEFRTLAPDDTLTRAVEHILAGCQQDLPVVDAGRIFVVPEIPPEQHLQIQAAFQRHTDTHQPVA
jgi:hypothetical protein